MRRYRIKKVVGYNTLYYPQYKDCIFWKDFLDKDNAYYLGMKYIIRFSKLETAKEIISRNKEIIKRELNYKIKESKKKITYYYD